MTPSCHENPNLEQLAEHSKDYSSFESKQTMTWCSNCGNYGILNALKRALVLENLGKKDFVMCFDVGCNSNASDKIEAYTIHGLHGRAISLAAGAKVANPKQKVIAMAGDGATFSEGINHLIHAIRNDYPILFIHHNNENYGLTIGQATACTPKGAKMNGTPDQVTADQINTLQVVLSMNPSFVARGYSGEMQQMTDLFRQGLNHKGFAYIEILQACPTFNKSTPDEWYAERVHDVKSLKDYDNQDIWAARKLVEHLGSDQIATGLIYHNPNKASFFETLTNREGIQTTSVEEVKAFDISGMLEKL